MSLLERFGFFNSPYDWLVIALLAFLFFGNRLPTVMRSLGEGVTEFKKGMNGPGGDNEDDEDEGRPRKASRRASPRLENAKAASRKRRQPKLS